MYCFLFERSPRPRRGCSELVSSSQCSSSPPSSPCGSSSSVLALVAPFFCFLRFGSFESFFLSFLEIVFVLGTMGGVVRVDLLPFKGGGPFTGEHPLAGPRRWLPWDAMVVVVFLWQLDLGTDPLFFLEHTKCKSKLGVYTLSKLFHRKCSQVLF